MTNNTVQIFGQGYGTEAISASVQINGSTVFTGEISTVNQLLSGLPEDQVNILEFELTPDAIIPVPVTVLFTGAGVVFVEQVFVGNYVSNPVYTNEDLIVLQDPNSTQAEKLPIYESAANPPLTSQDILVLENGTPEEQAQILQQHNLQLTTFSPYYFSPPTQEQTKSNVKINNISVTPSPQPTGEWGWQVPLNDGTGTITFDLKLPTPPVETI
jgi:hypothetical protein